MEFLGIAAALISAVPKLVTWFTGERAEERAKQIVMTAQSVSGIDDPALAVAALKDKPELLARFLEVLAQLELQFYQEDTIRLQTINTTIQVEASSVDPFTRRWRPFYGYCVAISWSVQMIGITLILGLALLSDQAKFNALVNKLPEIVSSTMMLWTVALSVLGIYVNNRTKEKTQANGQPIPEVASKGIIGAAKEMLVGKKTPSDP